MTAAALAGFSGAWALLHDVLSIAARPTPSAIATAANAVDLPRGLAAERQRLRFGEPGTVTAGANVLASSVVWQWQAPGEYAVVWPPRYATSPIERLDPCREVRSRALGAGLAVALVYAATAILSGHLSLEATPGRSRAARRIAGSSRPPSSRPPTRSPPRHLHGQARGRESKTAVFTTDDAQVTVILPEGSFEDAAGQRTVEVTVEPLAGATAHPDDPLHVVGNVYLVEATYQPSGDAAKLASLSTVVLVYPLLSNDHGSHSIWSRSGDDGRPSRPTTCRASSRPARTSTSSATSRSPDSRRRPPPGPAREGDRPSPRSRSSPG